MLLPEGKHTDHSQQRLVTIPPLLQPYNCGLVYLFFHSKAFVGYQLLFLFCKSTSDTAKNRRWLIRAPICKGCTMFQDHKLLNGNLKAALQVNCAFTKNQSLHNNEKLKE